MNTPTMSAGRPPGRWWWIASSALHLSSAAIFAVAASACLHWLDRVGTDTYYEAHKDADPDLMMMLQGVVLLLVAACAVAVVYAIVGFALSLADSMVGPAMLLASSLCMWLVGPVAGGELWPDGGALRTLVDVAALATTAAGVVASCVAMCRPQRRRAPAVPVPPPPYAGGSPYLRGPWR